MDSPDDCNTYGWDGLKPGAGNLIQVSPAVVGTQEFAPSLSVPSRKLDSQVETGLGHSVWCPNPYAKQHTLPGGFPVPAEQGWPMLFPSAQPVFFLMFWGLHLLLCLLKQLHPKYF